MKKSIFFIIIILIHASAFSQVKTTDQEAARYIGQTVTVCGKIYSGRYLESSSTQPTLLNMGGFFPNHTLTVLINKETRKNFPNKPEDYYVNKNVCITGMVIDYKGKPEISVTDAAAISVEGDGMADQVAEIAKFKKPAETERPKPIAERSTKPAVEQKSTPTPTSSTEVAVERPKKTATSTTSSTEVAVETPKKPTRIKLSTSINIRSGPGPKNSIIATLEAGTIVLVHLTQKDWSYISVDNRFLDPNAMVLQGFVKSSFLK